MTHYTPDEITGMIEHASSPEAGDPEVGLLLATRAQAAATLYVGQVLEEILIELQFRDGG